MKTKATLTGKVTRVAKLESPQRTEFTVDVRETKIHDRVLTIAQKVTFEVGASYRQPDCIRLALANLSAGDDVVVEMEKNDFGVWKVTAVSNQPHRGRPVGSFLGDIEEGLERRK